MKIEHSEKYSQYYAFIEPKDDDLNQSGIKGMRWGIRRWQNKDGSLTPLGRIHYGIGLGRKAKAKAKEFHEKGYTTSDYEGYKAFKKNQKYSSYRDKNWKLKPEAKDKYSEDIVQDIATRKAEKDYKNIRKKEHASIKDNIKETFNGSRKLKIKELSEKYRNSEEFHKIKAYLDARKDDVINIDKTKESIDIPEKFDYDFSKNKKERLESPRAKYLDSKTNLTAEEIVEKMAILNGDVFGHLRDPNSEDYRETVKSIRKEIIDEHESHLTSLEESYKNASLNNDTSRMQELLQDMAEAIEIYENELELYEKDTNHNEMKYGTKHQQNDSSSTPTGKATYNSNKKSTKQIDSEQNSQKLTSKAQSLKNQGYTVEEIAKKLGVPVGTVSSYLYS